MKVMCLLFRKTSSQWLKLAKECTRSRHCGSKISILCKAFPWNRCSQYSHTQYSTSAKGSEPIKKEENVANYRRVTVKRLDHTDIGGKYEVCGWVKHIRMQKHVNFIHITDGLSEKTLQLVVPSEYLPTSAITFGACVQAQGLLVNSPASGQSLELQCDKLQLLGTNYPQLFPFVENTRSYSADYIRKYLHLRAKLPEYAALLRIRSSCKQIINDFFHSQDFVQIDTPILTSNDCEGGGDVFVVHATAGPKVTSYFGEGREAYLTVSGQLHLEACNSGLSKVYTFGPTFRADNAVDRTHLAEFYMLEAEMSFLETVDQLENFIENFLKSISLSIVKQEQANLLVLYEKHTFTKPVDVLEMLCKPFHRLSYTQAIKLLQESNVRFEKPAKWGDDLLREHEHAILAAHNNMPVFVHDWPLQMKPFYARQNDDGMTAACVDLIVPGPGELFGGSIRECRYDMLKARLESLSLLQPLNWYLDLRQFGSAPHGGFGMGFERLLQFLFGIQQIRDTIPFPRYANSCKL